MEGYTAHFIPFDDINDEDRNPFDLYFGHIELKNGDNILTKFEFNISDIYEEPDFNLDAIYRIPQCNYIEIFLNFVKNLENLGEAKLSFRQRNGERYYSVKGDIFKVHFTEELFGLETNYIINKSLINAFKEIENIIKSKFKC
jgi:hypothetical protein